MPKKSAPKTPNKVAAPKPSKAVAAPKPKAAAKPAPAPKAPAKPVAKPAAKAAPKTAPRPGRPRKEGAANDYAVQARKMKALLDTLVTAEELTEARILEAMAEAGFPLHPRTLSREVERLAIIGFPVVRIHGPEGLLYAMPEDDMIGQAIAGLEAVRKALKKEGSAQEKAVSAVIKLLKD